MQDKFREMTQYKTLPFISQPIKTEFFFAFFFFQINFKFTQKACQLVLEQVEAILSQPGPPVPLCSTAVGISEEGDSLDGEDSTSDSQSGLPGRGLKLLLFTGAEVLPFCLQFLTSALRVSCSSVIRCESS